MENYCVNCKNLLEEDFEFCPYCSTPTTKKAEELDKKKSINAQLELLINLLKEVDDEKTLKIINKYIRALKNN